MPLMGVAMAPIVCCGRYKHIYIYINVGKSFKMEYLPTFGDKVNCALLSRSSNPILDILNTTRSECD